MSNQHPRAAIYARVSSGQQAKEDTIASQLEAVARRLAVGVAVALDSDRADVAGPDRLAADLLEARHALPPRVSSASAPPAASAAAKKRRSSSKVRPIVRVGSPLAR